MRAAAQASKRSDIPSEVDQMLIYKAINESLQQLGRPQSASKINDYLLNDLQLDNRSLWFLWRAYISTPQDPNDGAYIPQITIPRHGILGSAIENLFQPGKANKWDWTLLYHLYVKEGDSKAIKGTHWMTNNLRPCQLQNCLEQLCCSDLPGPIKFLLLENCLGCLADTPERFYALWDQALKSKHSYENLIPMVETLSHRPLMLKALIDRAPQAAVDSHGLSSLLIALIEAKADRNLVIEGLKLVLARNTVFTKEEFTCIFHYLTKEQFETGENLQAHIRDQIIEFRRLTRSRYEKFYQELGLSESAMRLFTGSTERSLWTDLLTGKYSVAQFKNPPVSKEGPLPHADVNRFLTELETLVTDYEEVAKHMKAVGEFLHLIHWLNRVWDYLGVKPGTQLAEIYDPDRFHSDLNTVLANPSWVGKVSIYAILQQFLPQAIESQHFKYLHRALRARMAPVFQHIVAKHKSEVWSTRFQNQIQRSIDLLKRLSAAGFGERIPGGSTLEDIAGYLENGDTD